MADKLGFIGGGNMSSAIIAGLIDSGVDPASIAIAEPVEEQRRVLAKRFPDAQVTPSNGIVAASAGVLVLGVKPQVLAAVCQEIRAEVQANQPLVISVAAGVRSTDIDSWLGGGLGIVRSMPNQPALLRRGITGIFANEQCTEDDRLRASRILGAVGEVVEVPAEPDIDAVTAVSGSGPAYFYLLIKLVTDAGCEMGLSEETARQLALATALGSCELAAGSGDSMDQLIARVRSPGGTTAAALDSLDSDNVHAIFRRALGAARDRAEALADDAHQPGKDS